MFWISCRKTAISDSEYPLFFSHLYSGSQQTTLWNPSFSSGVSMYILPVRFLSFQSGLFLYRRLMSGMDTSFSFSPFTLFSLFSLYSGTVNNSRRFRRFNSATPHHAHRSRYYPAPALCVMCFVSCGDRTSASAPHRPQRS